ncbi:MAG: thioesterase family protein [Clostridia bacterium]|nr:thioesterase family protein [Clostridia bacterium]
MNDLIGVTNKIEITVTEKDTAKVFGSGELEVLATPRMVALMEECAYKSLSPYLEEGSGTVGTLIEVKHLSATPVGMKVWSESVVTKVDGRCISFEIKAYDECGLIGEANHQRFIVFNEKFTQKTYSKLK